MKHNRNFIGIEREAEYVELSLNRWAKARLSPTFFTPAQQSVQRTAIAASQQASFIADGELPSKARGATRRR